MKIVVDSGCVLSDEMKNQKDIVIESVPLTMQLGEKIFIDDANLDVGEYLDEIARYPGTPKTAAPSPQEYLDHFEGEDTIFVVTLSAKLSASYNGAILAKDMYLEKNPNAFVHVFDSKSAVSGETTIALKICELARQNEPNEKIASVIDKFISEEMKTYFILENFDTAVKNGRMNPYAAKIAGVFNIKPICHALDGKMEFLDKARGIQKAFTKLSEIVAKDNNFLENRTLSISHVRNLERAEAVKEAILKKAKFKDVKVLGTTGLCATYASQDGVVIAY